MTPFPDIDNIDNPGRARRGAALERIRSIQEEVCLEYGVTMAGMLSDRRQKLIVAARHKAIRRAFDETDRTCTTIGRAFRRDHTTILYVIGKERTT